MRIASASFSQQAQFNKPYERALSASFEHRILNNYRETGRYWKLALFQQTALFDGFLCLCYIQILRGNSVRVLPARATDLPSADLQEEIWQQSPFPSFTKIS
jgi:hypothetical protein